MIHKSCRVPAKTSPVLRVFTCGADDIVPSTSKSEEDAKLL